MQRSQPPILASDQATHQLDSAAVGALAQRVSDADVKIDAHREAINALGEKVSGFQVEVRERFDTINRNREDDRTEAAAFRRSVEDGQAELKNLILLERPHPARSGSA